VARENQVGRDARLAFPIEWEHFVYQLKTLPLDLA
jgi:hypothetical protein